MGMFSNFIMQTWMYTVVAEIKSLQSNLTLEQIRDKEAKLSKEVRLMAEFGSFSFFFVTTRCRHVFTKTCRKVFDIACHASG